MREKLKYIIEYLTVYSIANWVIFFILLALIIFVLWKLIKKRQSKKNKEAKHYSDLIYRNESINNRPPKSKIQNKELTPSNLKPQNNLLTTKRDNSKSKGANLDKKIPSNNNFQVAKSNINKTAVISRKYSDSILPETKTERTNNQGNILHVNYEIYGNQETDSYPIFRFPKRGTVVRSYRIGGTKRRGFKEASFQRSIEHYFGNSFIIIGNARLNTSKDVRPFEPDIAIIDMSDKNLRIDIEIDEPYAGISRQPTHCKGDDVARDLYFIDRGWIVIRFAEIQVHKNEIGCLKFIASIIESVIPNYKASNELANHPKIQRIDLWNILQAQKWEKEELREKYLNHNFNYLPEQSETIERDLNQQELAEENLVTQSYLGVVEKKESSSYNLDNEQSRDFRIKFYREPHIYTIDNIPAPSVSTVISKFFPEFDASYFAKIKAPSLGMTPMEVQDMWETNRKMAALEGTLLHEQIEKFYLNHSLTNTREFNLFINFNNDHIHLTPFRTEWKIFDEEFHIAGTIDLIANNNGNYELYDWKRSKNIIDTNNEIPITHNRFDTGIGGLSDIQDTSYNRYCLQQSIYRYIIEKNYNIKISKTYLVVLHPIYNKYYKVEAPYQKDKAEYILKTLL